MSYICTQSVDNGSRFIVLVCIFVSAFLGLYGHDWLAGSMVAIIATVWHYFVLHKEPNKDNRMADTETDG